MYPLSRFVLNIAIFLVTVVSALDVRIETIEDDGTRDVWTFDNDNLNSRLHATLLVFGRPFVQRFALCYRSVVLYCLSVCL